jgi:hypothetical protein
MQSAVCGLAVGLVTFIGFAALWADARDDQAERPATDRWAVIALHDRGSLPENLIALERAGWTVVSVGQEPGGDWFAVVRRGAATDVIRGCQAQDRFISTFRQFLVTNRDPLLVSEYDRLCQWFGVNRGVGMAGPR